MPNKLAELIHKCTADADFFVFSGSMYNPNVIKFMNCVATGKKSDKVNLVLTTNGGDLHSAYRLGRFLQRLYSTIRVILVGPCKSAGTLVTIGADELSFGPWGELGPLDVKMAKKDELVFFGSGLDTMQAFTLITGHVYTAFENYMLQTVDHSGGAISFRTACDIASQLATGFIAPIAGQIDPHRLGEVERAMAIATAYGERLERGNLQDDSLEMLVNGYPSHAFIIDEEEARVLFKKVTFVSPEEVTLIALIDQKHDGCCFSESSDMVSIDVGSLAQEGKKSHEKPSDTSEQGPGASDRREPGANAAADEGRPKRRSKPNGKPGEAHSAAGGDAVPNS